MHHTRIESGPAGLVIREAILLYGKETNRGGYYHGSLATHHQVTIDENGAAEIGSGMPLTRRTLKAWQNALYSTSLPEILPANVLIHHQDAIAWWAPKQMRTAWFNLSQGHVSDKIRHLREQAIVDVPYPAHLFVATATSLSVFALKESVRPTGETVLYHSPVLNIFFNGKLCWGNVKQPSKPEISAIAEYERAVFDSWSTHPNPGQDRAIRHRGGLVALWDTLVDRKATSFPAHKLVPFTRSHRSNVSVTGRSSATEAPLTFNDLLQTRR